MTVADPLDHVQIVTDSTFSSNIQAGQVVAGFHVDGYDARGNRLGDVTTDSTFSIGPDGSCNNISRYCFATVAGAHTITATNPNAVNQTSTNSLSVTVRQTTIDHISVTGGSPRIYAASSTAPYHVTSSDRFGNTADVTNLTQFSVSPVQTTSGCNSPSAQPTCHAQTAGAHTVNVTFQTFHESIPLWVDPSLVLTQIALSGGPAGGNPRAAIGGTTPPYTVTFTDAYGNAGSGSGIDLTITPDGTCDRDALTCTPAAPGSHTVTAESLDGDVQSSPLTFTAVAADHLQLHGGSSSIAFGRATSPYQIEGFDTDGYDLGDVTDASPLSIAPDGSCDNTAHTCTANVGDSAGSHHTVTATYAYGAHPTASAPLTIAGVTRIELRGDTSPSPQARAPTRSSSRDSTRATTISVW